MVKIDEVRCIGCGKCVNDCVALNMFVQDKKAGVKRECLQCGHCVAICPVNAVSIPEYDMSEVEDYEAAAFDLDPQVLLHAIKFRRSIRTYKEQLIEKEKLQHIIQAGRYTATAVNRQDCCFVVVQEGLEAFREVVWSSLGKIVNRGYKEIPKEWIPFAGFYKRRTEDKKDDYLFRNAPAVVFVTADYPLDAGLAAQNMELMAVAEGLGMLYNGYLARAVNADEEVKKWLGIEGREVRACMLLGYPDVVYQRTAPRRSANVIMNSVVDF